MFSLKLPIYISTTNSINLGLDCMTFAQYLLFNSIVCSFIFSLKNIEFKTNIKTLHSFF